MGCPVHRAMVPGLSWLTVRQPARSSRPKCAAGGVPARGPWPTTATSALLWTTVSRLPVRCRTALPYLIFVHLSSGISAWKAIKALQEDYSWRSNPLGSADRTTAVASGASPTLGVRHVICPPDHHRPHSSCRAARGRAAAVPVANAQEPTFRTFVTHLSPGNEIPGCPPGVESGAHGVAIIQVNAATGEIESPGGGIQPTGPDRRQPWLAHPWTSPCNRNGWHRRTVRAHRPQHRSCRRRNNHQPGSRTWDHRQPGELLRQRPHDGVLAWDDSGSTRVTAPSGAGDRAMQLTGQRFAAHLICSASGGGRWIAGLAYAIDDQTAITVVDASSTSSARGIGKSSVLDQSAEAPTCALRQRTGRHHCAFRTRPLRRPRSAQDRPFGGTRTGVQGRGWPFIAALGTICVRGGRW